MTPKKLLWKCEEKNYSGRIDYIACERRDRDMCRSVLKLSIAKDFPP